MPSTHKSLSSDGQAKNIMLLYAGLYMAPLAYPYLDMLTLSVLLWAVCLARPAPRLAPRAPEASLLGPHNVAPHPPLQLPQKRRRGRLRCAARVASRCPGAPTAYRSPPTAHRAPAPCRWCQRRSRCCSTSWFSRCSWPPCSCRSVSLEPFPSPPPHVPCTPRPSARLLLLPGARARTC